jgi:mono/diheme cytochrome c family protein
MHGLARFAAVVTAALVAATPATAGAPSAGFAREVRPILKRACVDCHGPDRQKGGLRLDSRAAVLKGGDSGPAVVPGKPDDSELIRRVALAKGVDGAMPARGEPLTRADVDRLRAWVTAGAPWPDDVAAGHWAYVKPVRPVPPTVGASHWAKTPIDRFVLARLEAAGLPPSPEADRYTLARRVSLDLTGLPPTPAEVDAFVHDPAPDAYERLVDRLLASPAFGERWARPWLDLARYADSHGFQRDDLREVWPFRDWVIRALNADMPFDQFTVEQLAGDLLPDATHDQQLATGFHRCTPTNVEAGSEPEETRVNQVFDRVNTTAAAFAKPQSSISLATVLMPSRRMRSATYSPVVDGESPPRYALMETRFLSGSVRESKLRTSTLDGSTLSTGSTSRRSLAFLPRMIGKRLTCTSNCTIRFPHH